MGQPRYAYDSTKSSLILSYNMLKIMESVAMETQLQHQRVQLTFTIVKIQLWIHVGMVRVLLVIKHSYVILFWTWTLHMFFLQKVHKSVDAITKNWLYWLRLMSKHSCCQSKKWLFGLFNLWAVKSKFSP